MEDLKKQALKNICSCYYYELNNNLDEATRDDLEAMAEDAQYGHIMEGQPRSSCLELQHELIKERKKEPMQ